MNRPLEEAVVAPERGEATRVVVLDDYQDVARRSADWSVLEASCEVGFVHDKLEGEELRRRLHEADVVVLMRERTPLPRPLIESLPRLQLIVTTGMRNASLDLGAAADRGVTVCGTRSLAGPTAELTWALILGVTRRIPQESRSMGDGRWQEHLGIELEGKTLGILGLGHVGRRVARVARAFDMTVVAWSQNLTSAEAETVGVSRVEFEELLGGSDVVTIHQQLSDRTRGLIGAPELEAMKPSAYLVNTSRGEILDEPALIAAVREKRIAGAALDVFAEEPLPTGHVLRNTPGILSTGHVGYVTEGNYRTYYRDAVEDIVGFLTGTPVRVIT